MPLAGIHRFSIHRHKTQTPPTPNDYRPKKSFPWISNIRRRRIGCSLLVIGYRRSAEGGLGVPCWLLDIENPPKEDSILSSKTRIAAPASLSWRQRKLRTAIHLEEKLYTFSPPKKSSAGGSAAFCQVRYLALGGGKCVFIQIFSPFTFHLERSRRCLRCEIRLWRTLPFTFYIFTS